MSMFGQTKPAGSGGLFGQPQPAQQSQPTAASSIFGQAMANQQNNNTTGNNALGQQQNAQQMPALSQSQAQLSSSLWQPGRDTPHQQKPIVDQIKLVTEKWDPSGPSCVFKHYFYNKVDEAHVPFYKPQPHEDANEWEEALQKKPASGYMPVLCSGFTGVADRLKTQKRAINDFNTRLHQINGSLDAILQRHELETEVRALAARRRQTAISERCLVLAAKVQILRNRGYALSADEDDLKNRLQVLERQVNDPAVGAREEEMWSRLISLRVYSDRLSKELDQPGGQDGEGLDPETEAKAKKVLEDYEKQLQHLRKEVEILAQDLQQWEKSRQGNSKFR
ncbi:hypothetical protein E4U28_005959 [Claviceps purpurea]|nr:hypothetical protein E4U28_005959 [Claviceps purpurea]